MSTTPSSVLSAASAYLVTDILADNTDPATNPLWGPRFQLATADGGRRPATLKTGTTNDFKDLQAVGYLAAEPRSIRSTRPGAIVTGVWVGNCDFSAIQDVFAADGPTFIWHDYMAEVAALNELPVRDFARPEGVVEVEVDAISGMLPGELTETTVTEVFRSDNAPTTPDTRPPRAPDRGRDRQDLAGGLRRLRDRPAVGTPGPSEEPDAARGARGALCSTSLGWEEERPTWEAANRAWIADWSGREDELNGAVRVPYPGPLDAPLAPDRGVHAGRGPDLDADRRPPPPPRRLRRRRHRRPIDTPIPTLPPVTPIPTLPPVTPVADAGADRRRSVASARAPRRSPRRRPRPLRPPAEPRTRGCSAQRVADRATQRPGADAVDDLHAVEAGQQRFVEVRLELLERRLDALAAEIDAR